MEYSTLRSPYPAWTPDEDVSTSAPSSLVVFGEDWGGLPSSTQHLMRCLSADRSILWINSIGMRRPRLVMSDLRRLGKKLGSMIRSARGQQLSNGRVAVLAPLVLSWPGVRMIDSLNSKILGRQINRAIASEYVQDPIVWATLPTAVVLLDAINTRKLVYYCGDDYSALPGVNPEVIRKLETQLVDRADLIFVSSEVLAERFPKDRTIFLPHGVDVDLFGKPCQRAQDLPTNRLIAGYYGSIAEWLDLEMIRSAATRMPNWDFVLIGPVTTDISSISSLSNVKLLGSRPHRELASYSQHWTVSLLPFKQNAWTTSFNPLKLREYLAAGTPVASTSFPALQSYKDLISVAADPTDFEAAIRRAAEDRDRNALRRHRVQKESWSARASEVSRHLERL